MRVRLITSVYAAKKFNVAGTIVNLPDDVAHRLIESGAAIPALERAIKKPYERAIGEAQR